jgi:protein O-GlcNAc transferase
LNTDLEPDDAIAIDLAIADYQAGRTAAAQVASQRILAKNQKHPKALHLLATIACDDGDLNNALRLIDTAIELEPSSGAFHNARARVLVGLNRLHEAEVAYRDAFALWPQAMEIANNLACLLRDKGDIQGAVDWFVRAQQLAPTSPDVACNLAEALAAKGEHAESIEQFQRALMLRPSSADILAKFGRLLLTLGRLKSAEQCYLAALARRPEDAASHNNFGLVLQGLGRSRSARECFRNALRYDSAFADAHYNLGCFLQLDNCSEEARYHYDRAIAVTPPHGAALWARCMVELPILYQTQEQIGFQRARYTKELERLSTKSVDPSVANALGKAVGSCQPFFLPYQGESDRQLQSTYGSMVARVLQNNNVSSPRPPLSQKVRIGIVSGYFCEHTIWRLMLKGWLTELDRSCFEVHVYHTGAIEDAQTALAAKACDRYTRGSAHDIRSAILTDCPHVLLYPEIGMDPVCARLAGERLAPVQCVSWGQPETSGLPTMDYFLSSDLMEPPEAASYYTEQLIRLPNLGIYYTSDDRIAEPCSREAFGLRDGAVIFWCGQALYKYLPQHDDVFAQIAAQLHDCQFLFIGFERSHAVTEQFRDRLRKAFATRGLDADRHCVILEPMSQGRFLGTIQLADIMLDSIGWSGGKSTLDALSQLPVIITQACRFMRGRHTAAILTAIGVTDTIVDNTEDYIATAIRLALDPIARSALKARMAEGVHRVMADRTPVREMELFFKRATALTATAAGIHLPAPTESIIAQSEKQRIWARPFKSQNRHRSVSHGTARSA